MLPCTQIPPTDKYLARELPIPHPAGTTDSQESTKLGGYMEKRKDNKTYSSHKDPRMHPGKAKKLHQTYRSLITEGASDLQGTRGQHPDKNSNTTPHNALERAQAKKKIVTKKRGGRTRRLHHAEKGKSLHTGIRVPTRPVRGLDQHLDITQGRGEI